MISLTILESLKTALSKTLKRARAQSHYGNVIALFPDSHCVEVCLEQQPETERNKAANLTAPYVL